MDILAFSFFVGPIIFGLIAWLRGAIYRKHVVNKRKELKKQVVFSVWASFILCCFLFYDQFQENSKIFYFAFLFDIFLTVSFLLLLKQFNDDEIF